jgi:hypothetical protein
VVAQQHEHIGRHRRFLPQKQSQRGRQHHAVVVFSGTELQPQGLPAIGQGFASGDIEADRVGVYIGGGAKRA